MERKHIPETENRLLILYALARLGPVTDAQLLTFLAGEDLMDYITLRLSLSELEARGQAARAAHPLGELWEPTPEGRYALESFARRIPASRRERVDARAEAYRERFRQERLTPADALTLPDGSVCVRLRLTEAREALMELRLYLPERPTLLEKRWAACAQAIYEAILSALTEGFSPDTPDSPDAPVPPGAVRETAAGEWLLTLADRDDAPTLALLMSLPGERLARYAASRWPACCAALREAALRELAAAL